MVHGEIPTGNYTRRVLSGFRMRKLARKLVRSNTVREPARFNLTCFRDGDLVVIFRKMRDTVLDTFPFTYALP